MTRFFTLLFASAVLLAPLQAQDKNQLFFRLEAIEYTEDEVPNEVKLNIPLSLVKAIQPQVDEALLEANFGFYYLQFQQAWQEIKNAGPFTVVEIFHEGETIRVSTTETHIVVNARNAEFGNAVVRIPLSIGDALFNMNGTISFAQLMAEVELLAGQDLITVESDKFDLRIWIN